MQGLLFPYSRLPSHSYFSYSRLYTCREKNKLPMSSVLTQPYGFNKYFKGVIIRRQRRYIYIYIYIYIYLHFFRFATELVSIAPSTTFLGALNIDDTKQILISHPPKPLKWQALQTYYGELRRCLAGLRWRVSGTKSPLHVTLPIAPMSAC